MTSSCGPVSAAMAAFWVTELTFEVACPCSELHWVMNAAGPIAQPQRHPVIAYAFEAALHRTARSRSLSTRMRGRLCGTGS